jgi:hypothetical protein
MEPPCREFQYRVYGRHGVTAPLPEMNEEDRRLGCTKCQSIKPAPKSPRAYHYLVGKQARNRIDVLEAGHCGQCGTFLTYVECECQEPLHDEEIFCRNCGRNNAEKLAKWGILDPRYPLKKRKLPEARAQMRPSAANERSNAAAALLR